MNRTAQITVGIPTGCLHESHPRGVTRTARAIAERMLHDQDLQLLAIAEPSYDSGELYCESEPLCDWLDRHPLQQREAHRPAARFRRAASVGRKLIAWVGLARPGRYAYRLARRAIRGSRSLAPNHSQHARSDFISVRDLDAVLSFECYDPIWQWPLESYGCRMVGLFHDAIPLRINEGADWRPNDYLRAAGLMALRAASVCCDSESSRNDLEAFFPAARGKNRVVHLGHDVERFSVPHAHTRHEKRIAMVGDISRRKNQAGVLRAMRFVASAFPDERITLRLIGHQRTADSIEFLLQEARRYVNIETTGFVDDAALPGLLASCDCFVYPSLWEGFGIPVLEAMSAGVPVVASDAASLPEVAGPNLIYCDPYEPRSIAAGISRVLGMSSAERGKFTTAARAWSARFTWEATAAKFCSHLKELVHPARLQAA